MPYLAAGGAVILLLSCLLAAQTVPRLVTIRTVMIILAIGPKFLMSTVEYMAGFIAFIRSFIDIAVVASCIILTDMTATFITLNLLFQFHRPNLLYNDGPTPFRVIA